MPITFEPQPDLQLVVIRHVGDIPDDEMLDFYRGFLAGPDAAQYLNLLVHLEETRSSGRSSQALRALAQLLEGESAGGEMHRRVAVVAPTDHSFGLARMYEALSGRIPWEFRVFRDVTAAREWLVSGLATET